MTKAISIFFLLLVVLLLVSCTVAAQSQATMPVEGSYSGDTSGIAGGSTPVPTTDPEPIATTEPDSTSTSSPEPDPSSSSVPAGIVKNSGEVIGTGVALREAPNPDSKILMRLDKGTFVQILKTNVNAQWHQIKYDGKTGYISRMYICLDSSLDGYSLDYVATIVNCKNDVNVRSEPSTESEIIGVAKKGASLTILAQDEYTEGWYRVEFEGKDAYIYADYLNIEANADDTQLTSLSISGGSLFPSFSPKEYGYVVKSSSSRVTINAKANSGVKIDINGSGKSSVTVDIPSAGMKTIRIALDGEIRYSLYISRNVITVGTWNIKRGDGHLLMQGRLVYDQQPDIMGIQEAFQNLKASDIIDNLASLKTKDMSHNIFSTTIKYSNGSRYGIGILSRYKLNDVETYTLYSGSYEKRVLQKAVVSINGKTVSLYNTHFTYNSAAVRAKQFAKVLEVMNADKNKYKILTGDFNANISEFSVFKDYTVVNTDKTKYYDYSKKEININEIDNIIVTKNIDVINSRMIVNSFSDHYPVFAYLVFN